MALPAGRYGVTKNQLLKIKKLPMNTIKLIEELTEKFDLLGTAAFKNSTSVVTDSTDLVESGAVKDIVGWGNKNLCYYKGVNNTVVAQCKNGVTYTFSLTSTGHGGVNLKKNDNSGDEVTAIIMSEGRNSVTFTADSDFNLFMNGYGRGGIGFTDDVSDLQLEVGSTATAYEPYHASVEETLRDAEVIEGKNLLPVLLRTVKTLNTGGTWSGNTYTIGSLTLLFEEREGYVTKITVNGSSGNDLITIQLSNGWIPFVSGNYIVSGFGSANARTYVNPDHTAGYYDNGNGQVFTVNTVLTCRLQIDANKSFTNIIVQPMIRLATETDSTYEPYYTPLKDVVPTKADNSVIGTVEGATASKAWSVGEHFIKDGAFKEVTQPIASGGAINDSNTVDKPIAEILTELKIKSATFSGTTDADGNLAIIDDTNSILLSAECKGRLAFVFKSSTKSFVKIVTDNLTALANTSVSGTYYYI